MSDRIVPVNRRVVRALDADARAKLSSQQRGRAKSGKGRERQIELMNREIERRGMGRVVRIEPSCRVVGRGIGPSVQVIFDKKAATDYLGWILGRPFALEVKNLDPDADRFYFRNIKPHQMEYLSAATVVGGLGVLAILHRADTYAVPWPWLHRAVVELGQKSLRVEAMLRLFRVPTGLTYVDADEVEISLQNLADSAKRASQWTGL